MNRHLPDDKGGFKNSYHELPAHALTHSRSTRESTSPSPAIRRDSEGVSKVKFLVILSIELGEPDSGSHTPDY